MSLRSFLLACVFAFTPCGVTDASEAVPQECHATAFIGTSYRDQQGTGYSFRSEVGVFADGYASPTSGQLIHATDYFDDMGCSLPWRETSTRSWVALIRLGGCSLETKIENALRENASGVIIYNHRDSLNLFKMRTPKKFQGLITVVFTYKWKGDELKALYDSGTKVLVDLGIANPCAVVSSDPDRNMQLVSISFLCFIVLTISLAWLIFYYVQRYRDLQAKERKARGYSDADEKALKAIPTKTIKTNDKLLMDESECCAICIDPYRPSEVVRTLVCNHEFHKTCIDPWLLENRTCPMCKKDILRHYGSVFTGSQESILQVIAEEASRLAGPSSPEIEVIVIDNDLDEVEDSNLPSPHLQDSNEMTILTEDVQPVNTDDGYIAGSSAFLTVNSAIEALESVVCNCDEENSEDDAVIEITACPDKESEVIENVESTQKDEHPSIEDSKFVESEDAS